MALMLMSGRADTTPVGDTALEIAVAALSAGSTANFAHTSGFSLNLAQMEWQSSFYYDAVHKVCQMMGKEANDADSWGHQTYDLADDAWTSRSCASMFGYVGHIYDNFTMNTVNGNLYCSPNGTSNEDELFMYSYSGQSWSEVHSDICTGANNAPFNGVCWHPNLFGDGESGVVLCTETDGDSAGLMFYRESNGVRTQTDTSIDTGNGEGVGQYLPGLDRCVFGGSDQSGSASNHALVIPGATPTVSNVGQPPIRTAGTSQLTGGTFGTLHVHPGDPTRMLLLERRNARRVWESTDLNNWTQVMDGGSPYVHPLEADGLIICSLTGLDTFWGMGDGGNYSVLWKPDF